MRRSVRIPASAPPFGTGFALLRFRPAGRILAVDTGNAAAAGLSTYIFVPSRAPRGKVAQLRIFGATVIIFHGFLGRTSRHFAENLGGACKFMAIGLVALYGLNELVYRLTRLVVSNQTNLNDTTISAQIEDAPHMTLLIVIFLAPFVEEVLFRGLVFGNLRRKSAAVGYLVSCLLFALLHVWQFAVVNRDITYFLLMLQYLVPGLVLAWVYDRTGTLWTSIGLHAAANALSAWTLVA